MTESEKQQLERLADSLEAVGADRGPRVPGLTQRQALRLRLIEALLKTPVETAYATRLAAEMEAWVLGGSDPERPPDTPRTA